MECCIDFIAASQPKVFILENVKGMVTWRKGAFFLELMARLRDIGGGRYVVNHEVLSTHRYGVPQRRMRLYIVGIRSDLTSAPFAFPLPVASIPLTDLLLPAHLDSEASPTEGFDYLTAAKRAAISRARAIAQVSNMREWVIDDGLSYEYFSPPVEGIVPTLLRSRSNGYWIGSRDRRLRLSEAALLHGFLPSTIIWPSRPAGFAMLGNTMLACVLQRLFVR